MDALEVAQNKLLMLYILIKAKRSITYKVFLELVTTLTEINYFEFHEALEELIEEEYILKSEKENQEPTNVEYLEASIESRNIYDKKEKVKLYGLTTKGEEAVKIAISMIPGIKKLKIDTDFSKQYKAIRQAVSISAEYSPQHNKVICRVGEDTVDIIKIELKVDSPTQAKTIIKNWNERADKYYLDILNQLIKEEDDDELAKDNLTIDLYSQMVKERKEAEKIKDEENS